MSSQFVRRSWSHGVWLAGFIGLILLLFALAARVAGAAEGSPDAATTPAADDNQLTMVVMDPLALPLSCPCVQGYAQRNYDKLAETLEKELGRKCAWYTTNRSRQRLKGTPKGAPTW